MPLRWRISSVLIALLCGLPLALADERDAEQARIYARELLREHRSTGHFLPRAGDETTSDQERNWERIARRIRGNPHLAAPLVAAWRCGGQPSPEEPLHRDPTEKALRLLRLIGPPAKEAVPELVAVLRSARDSLEGGKQATRTLDVREVQRSGLPGWNDPNIEFERFRARLPLGGDRDVFEHCLACLRCLAEIGPDAKEALPELNAWLDLPLAPKSAERGGAASDGQLPEAKLFAAIAAMRIDPTSRTALAVLTEMWGGTVRRESYEPGFDSSLASALAGLTIPPADVLAALAKALPEAGPEARGSLAYHIAHSAAEPAQISAMLAPLAASADRFTRDAARFGQNELAQRQEEYVLRAAIEAKNAAPLLARLTRLRQWNEELAAEHALASLAAESPAVTGELVKRLQTGNEASQRAAARIFLRIPKLPATAIDPLVAALSVRDINVRECAAGALVGQPVSAERLIGELKKPQVGGPAQFAARLIALSPAKDPATMQAMKDAGQRFPVYVGFFLSRQPGEKQAAIQLLTEFQKNNRSGEHGKLAELILARLNGQAGDRPMRSQDLAERLLLEADMVCYPANFSDRERAQWYATKCQDAETALAVAGHWLQAGSQAGNRQLDWLQLTEQMLKALAEGDEAAAKKVLESAIAGRVSRQFATEALKDVNWTRASASALAGALDDFAAADKPQEPTRAERDKLTEPQRQKLFQEGQQFSDKLVLAAFALDRLSDLGPDAAPAVPAIEGALRKHALLEDRALATLVWIGQPAAGTLVKMLGDPSIKQVALVGAALRLIAPQAVDLLPQLVAIASSDDPQRVQWAATAMAEMGAAGRDQLAQLIAQLPAERRPRLVAGLSGGGAGCATHLAAIALDKQQPGEVRLAAAQALARLDGSAAAALDSLVVLLDAETPQLRVAASAAIERLPAGATAPPPAITRLVDLVPVPAVLGFRTREFLEDSDVQIIRALAKLGPPARPAARKLVQWLGDRRGDEVARALSRIGPDAACVKSLFAMLDKRETRFAAEISLAAADEVVIRESLPLLTEQLDSSSHPARAYAAFLVGRLGPDARQLVPQLRKSLRVDHDAVLIATAFALGRIGPDAKAARPDLEELLQGGQADAVQREFRRTLELLAVAQPPAAPGPQEAAARAVGAAAGPRFRLVALPRYEGEGDGRDEIDVSEVKPPPVSVLSLSNAGVVLAQKRGQYLTLREGKWQPLTLPTAAGVRQDGWHIAARNDAGHLVGECSPGGRSSQAYLYRDGKTSLLPALVESPRRPPDCGATGVSSRGDAVGWSRIATASDDNFWIVRACRWQDGKAVELPRLAGGDKSLATAINDAGLIVGQSEIAGERNGDGDRPSRACQWKDGKVLNLGILPGFRDSIAIAVTAGGLIAGRSYTRLNPGETPEDFDGAPCLWKDGKIVALGTFGGRDSSTNGINKQGQVVGSSQTKEDEFFPKSHAFLWEAGKLHDLNDLIPPEQKSRWVLRDARAINDRGQILVVGQLRNELHNVLLEPIAEAARP